MEHGGYEITNGTNQPVRDGLDAVLDVDPGFRFVQVEVHFDVNKWCFRLHILLRHFRVNTKVFARWLRRNATKVCKTVVALHMERTDQNDQDRRTMDSDLVELFRLDEADRELAPVGQDDMDGY